MSNTNTYALGSKRLATIEMEMFNHLENKTIPPKELKKKFNRRASQKTIDTIIEKSVFFNINHTGDAEIKVSSHDATITYDFTYQGADHNVSIKIDGKSGSVGSGKVLKGIRLYGPRYRLKAYVTASEPGRIWTFTPTSIEVEGDQRVMNPREEKGNRNKHIDNPTNL
ncbi:hypothetical protein [Aquimarina sediminis]|uniref:hypothetical protein n=1 Tax=Aquimarina sediminis TaxID=2070536 RepID=UPI000CA07C02|nr:hypothetical protein [Aquimarina sediminis]